MKTIDKKHGQRGFSLIEIMVAMMLIVLIFSIIPSDSLDEEHQALETTVEDFNRAIRFAANESILRNAVTRLVIDLNETPQEYYVEYSTQGGLALPTPVDVSDLSITEREEHQKSQKKLDSQFQKVQEFSDQNTQVPEQVMVTGLANINIESIIQSGQAMIYFYPNGEKDASLLFLSTSMEMAALEIPGFENTTFSKYSIYTESELLNLDMTQQSKMKSLHADWIKN